MDNTIVLSFLMLERVGLILILACLLVGIRSFREVLFDNHTASARVRLILIFSLFAIFANITGVAIDPDNNIQASGFILNLPKGYSIANTRLLAVTTSGIIGGSSCRWDSWCGCRHPPDDPRRYRRLVLRS